MDEAFIDQVRERQREFLPGELDFAFTALEGGRIAGRFTVARKHMAPNRYLHAGAVVTFADTACGYGTMVNRPDGAVGFTTIELKSNFLGTSQEGADVTCEAWLVHGGRSTQVWDAQVKAGDKTIALFRCTQMILYPK